MYRLAKQRGRFCRQRQTRIGGTRMRRVVGHGERRKRPNARKPAVAAGRGSRLPPPRHAARRGASGRMGGRLRFGRRAGARHRAQYLDGSGGLGGRMSQHSRAGRAADFGNRPFRRRGHADAGGAGRGRNRSAGCLRHGRQGGVVWHGIKKIGGILNRQI